MNEDKKLEIGTCISDGTCIAKIVGVVPMADIWCYNVEVVDRVAGLIVTYNDKMLHNSIVKRWVTSNSEDWDEARKLDAMDTPKFYEITGKYPQDKYVVLK